MKTPTQMNRSFASLIGMTPSATLSATSLGDATLRRTKHLHGLRRILDRHFVEHDGRGLASRFGATTARREVKPSLLLTKRVGEGRFGGAAARPNEEVYMGNFVAFTDERLADHQFGNLGHVKKSSHESPLHKTAVEEVRQT